MHCGSFAEKDSGVVDMSHSVVLLLLFVMLMSPTVLIQGSLSSRLDDSFQSLDFVLYSLQKTKWQQRYLYK